VICTSLGSSTSATIIRRRSSSIPRLVCITDSTKMPTKSHFPLGNPTLTRTLCNGVPFVPMFWHVPRFLQYLSPYSNAFGSRTRIRLFAVTTPHRHEIEFQGSNDGEHWVAYPFRDKPQELDKRSANWAPYQPCFYWSLWFASLGKWKHNSMVPRTEELLLENDRALPVCSLANPSRPHRRVWSALCSGNIDSAPWNRITPLEYGDSAGYSRPMPEWPFWNCV
jgi:hypothetical protein